MQLVRSMPLLYVTVHGMAQPVGRPMLHVMSLTFMYVSPAGSTSAIVMSKTVLYMVPAGSTSAIVIS